MACPVGACNHESCVELQGIARALDFYAVPAFLTDPLNRIVRVNRAFAQLVGDPVRDGVPRDLRFVASAMLGPYRDRFPRRKEEVAACLSSLAHEVSSGALAPGALRLAQEAMTLDEDVQRMAARTNAAWDGTVLIRSEHRKMILVRERVIPLVDARDTTNGFHVSLWHPADQAPEMAPVRALCPDRGVMAALTPRQRQVAAWYAAGLTAREVAAKAGISHRTARDHLEEIYSRLDVHSRAELATILARSGLL